MRNGHLPTAERRGRRRQPDGGPLRHLHPDHRDRRRDHHRPQRHRQRKLGVGRRLHHSAARSRHREGHVMEVRPDSRPFARAMLPDSRAPPLASRSLAPHRAGAGCHPGIPRRPGSDVGRAPGCIRRVAHSLHVVATALTTYLTVSNTVIASYNTNDQILPTSIIIQRLIRSEVEPAPTPTASGQINASQCPVLNAPCPPFVLGSVGTTSTTFYANVGTLTVAGTQHPGPAKIVMSASHAHQMRGVLVLHLHLHRHRAGTGPQLLSLLDSLHRALHIHHEPGGHLGVPDRGDQRPDQPAQCRARRSSPTTPSIRTRRPTSREPPASQPAPASRPPSPPSTGSPPTPPRTARPTTSRASASTSRCVQAGSQKETYQENSFVVYRLSSASYLYRQNLG